MFQVNAKAGLVVVLALGFLAFHAKPAQAQRVDPRLGIRVTFGEGKKAKGATIVGFLPYSPARRAGLELGDVILRIDGHDVDNVQEYARHSNGKKGKKGEVLTLHVKNGTGKARNVKVTN